jgi:hypothetical protein
MYKRLDSVLLTNLDYPTLQRIVLDHADELKIKYGSIYIVLSAIPPRTLSQNGTVEVTVRYVTFLYGDPNEAVIDVEVKRTWDIPLLRGMVVGARCDWQEDAGFVGPLGHWRKTFLGFSHTEAAELQIGDLI